MTLLLQHASYTTSTHNVQPTTLYCPCELPIVAGWKEGQADTEIVAPFVFPPYSMMQFMSMLLLTLEAIT